MQTSHGCKAGVDESGPFLPSVVSAQRFCMASDFPVPCPMLEVSPFFFQSQTQRRSSDKVSGKQSEFPFPPIHIFVFLFFSQSPV